MDETLLRHYRELRDKPWHIPPGSALQAARARIAIDWAQALRGWEWPREWRVGDSFMFDTPDFRVEVRINHDADYTLRDEEIEVTNLRQYAPRGIGRNGVYTGKVVMNLDGAAEVSFGWWDYRTAFDYARKGGASKQVAHEARCFQMREAVERTHDMYHGHTFYVWVEVVLYALGDQEEEEIARSGLSGVSVDTLDDKYEMYDVLEGLLHDATEEAKLV